MPATVVDAVHTPLPCPCNCHAALSLDERAAGIEALYRFDDAMRGWGQLVIWDLAAPTLWRLQQNLGEVKWVAVRDGGCIHSRLLGFCVHETIHALCGDPSLPNYGMPVGLPYGVPESVPPTEEAAYLHPFNQNEARAWVGMTPLGYRLFGIEWPLLPARDVGTYGFAGGNALVDVPTGPPPPAALLRARAQARGRGPRVVHRRAARRARRAVPGRRGDRPRDAPLGLSAGARGGAAAPRQARPQRSVPVRLDAEVEALPRGAGRRGVAPARCGRY